MANRAQSVGRAALSTVRPTRYAPPKGTRFFAGGAPKAQWSSPPTQQYGPHLKDNAYYGENYNYSPFILWLRGIRPYLEKIGSDVGGSLSRGATAAYTASSQFTRKHNPDLRYQFVALGSFAAALYGAQHFFAKAFQERVDIENLLELEEAAKLEKEGFWKTESQDTRDRIQDFDNDVIRLNNMWEDTLREATTLRSFDAFLEKLDVEKMDAKVGLPPPVTWRFDMIPYGADNPDTQTFPVPSNQLPHRPFALSFTYNNLVSDWGDYINRQDNKPAVMRPHRSIFTDVFIPPTK